MNYLCICLELFACSKWYPALWALVQPQRFYHLYRSDSYLLCQRAKHSVIAATNISEDFVVGLNLRALTNTCSCVCLAIVLVRRVNILIVIFLFHSLRYHGNNGSLKNLLWVISSLTIILQASCDGLSALFLETLSRYHHVHDSI